MKLLNSGEIHAFRDRILSLSGQDVARCVQCGKCSGGCPISPDMDLQPNQVMRLVQINDRPTLLASSTIWLCASCRTCSVRCPQEVDIAAIMDVLRKLTLEEKVPPGKKEVARFNEIFLGVIQKRGRIHELELMGRYNLALGQPFKDAHLGPKMLKRRRLGLFGEKIKGLGSVQSIFAKSKRLLKG